MRKSNSIIFAALAGTFLLSAETAAWFNGTSYNNFSQSGVGPFRKIANVLSYGTALNYFNIIPTSITTSGGLTQASYTTSNSTNPIKYTTQANPYPFVLGSASVPVHLVYYHNNDLPDFATGGSATCTNCWKIYELVLSNINNSNWITVLQKYYYILSNGTKQYVSGVTLGHVDFFQCSWGWAGKTTTTACSSVSGSDLQYVLNTVLFNKAAFSNTPAASNAAVYMIILGPTITESIGVGAIMSGDYCSYHSIFNAQQINNLLPATSQLSGVGSVNINYAVVPIPHPTISPACLFNPNTAHSKPWPGQNQALVGDVGNSITIMLHELVEAILNEAWYDSDGEEVMDKCVGTFSNMLSFTASSDASSFPGLTKVYNQWAWTSSAQSGGYLFTAPSIFDPQAHSCTVNGFFTLNSMARSNLCLDQPALSTVVGTYADVQDCNLGANQIFSFTNNVIKFANVKGSWLCLDVPSQNFVSGQKIWQYTCNNTPAQNWQYNPIDHTIRPMSSTGLCLTIGSTASNTVIAATAGSGNGMNTYLVECTSPQPASNQKWYFGGI